MNRVVPEAQMKEALDLEKILIRFSYSDFKITCIMQRICQGIMQYDCQ